MKHLSEKVKRRKCYCIFFICSIIAFSLFSILRYDWKARLRVDLLTKGYIFPEIRTEINKDDFANRSISEFAIGVVYSGKQYVGYVNNNFQFISSAGKLKSTPEIIYTKQRGICEIVLYLGQTISAVFIILFIILLIKKSKMKKGTGSDLKCGRARSQ